MPRRIKRPSARRLHAPGAVPRFARHCARPRRRRCRTCGHRHGLRQYHPDRSGNRATSSAAVDRRARRAAHHGPVRALAARPAALRLARGADARASERASASDHRWPSRSALSRRRRLPSPPRHRRSPKRVSSPPRSRPASSCRSACSAASAFSCSGLPPDAAPSRLRSLWRLPASADPAPRPLDRRLARTRARLLVAVALIHRSLVGEIDGNIEVDAPAYYFLDVEAADLDAFRDTVQDIEPAAELDDAPMLRGRIVTLSEPVEKVEAARCALGARRRPRPHLCRRRCRRALDSSPGEWWPKDYSGAAAGLVRRRARQGTGIEARRHHHGQRSRPQYRRDASPRCARSTGNRSPSTS